MLELSCAATGIGSFPHKDPYSAVKLILESCPDIPFWPQLPKCSHKEDMLLQYIENIPGVREDRGGVYFLKPDEVAEEIEKFYVHFSSDNSSPFALSSERASGFDIFLQEVKKVKKPLLLKGQVCGPITLGGTLKTKDSIPIIYDENYKDIIIKYLGRQGKWQEEKFKSVFPDIPTLIFLDEPLLTSYGSVGFSLSPGEIIEILNNCLSYLSGLSGIHICGATDWAMIMQTNIKVIHFDAYSFRESFFTYPDKINNFLKKGGMIGWGIIPSGMQEEKIEIETAENLVNRYEESVNILSKEGIDRDLILQKSLIAPSCGLASLTEKEAERVMQLTKNVSEILQERYNF